MLRKASGDLGFCRPVVLREQEQVLNTGVHLCSVHSRQEKSVCEHGSEGPLMISSYAVTAQCFLTK